ncbi:hypothetical protein [Spirosoma aerolatum]|uniref:hypothetical protein n=1 Tax=Spirosoma aerolatum TaxID=1211326 RepID=UPI0012D2C26A|nr:hypothetical protein [Spirosoma aerolatum]
MFAHPPEHSQCQKAYIESVVTALVEQEMANWVNKDNSIWLKEAIGSSKPGVVKR